MCSGGCGCPGERDVSYIRLQAIQQGDQRQQQQGTGDQAGPADQPVAQPGGADHAEQGEAERPPTADTPPRRLKPSLERAASIQLSRRMCSGGKQSRFLRLESR